MSGFWFFVFFFLMLAAINVKCLDLFAGDRVKDIILFLYISWPHFPLYY